MFDLATAYTKTGLTVSPTNDLLLQGSLDAALDIVEGYLNRKLMYADQVAEVLHVQGRSIQLSRYPVESIHSVTGPSSGIGAGQGNLMNGRQVNKLTGTILFDYPVIARNATVAYAGGYKVLPAGIELALWMTFDAVYAASGAGSGSGSAGLAAGSIESVSLQGVGTVRYATGGTGSDGGGNNTGTTLIPPGALSILLPYRLEVA